MNQHTEEERKTNGPRVFMYRGTVPPVLALLLFAPLLLVFLSLAAAVVTGGAFAAFVLPLFLRRRLRRTDSDVITLDHDQYTHIEPEAPKLPPR